MSKFFTTLTFTFFLLFQTTALAEEAETQEQTMLEDVPETMPEDISMDTVVPETDVPEAKEPTEIQEQEPTENSENVSEEETEAVSEAQREAHAAEEAELREAGVGEEPEAE